MSKILKLIILILLPSFLFSQIKGVVKDDNGNRLPSANVILLDSIQEIEAFAISDKMVIFYLRILLLVSKRYRLKRRLIKQLKKILLLIVKKLN